MLIFSYLDIPTLLFVNIVMVAGCMVSQIIVIKWKPDISGVSFWAWGNFIACAGCFGLFLRVLEGMYALSIIVGNGMITLGYYLIYVGVCDYVGKSRPGHKVFVPLFSAYLLALAYYSLVYDSLTVRSNLFCLSMVILCCAIVFQGREQLAKRSLAYWAFAILFSEHILFNLYRIIASFRFASGSAFFEGGALAAETFTEGFIFTFAASMGYLLLIAARFQEELRQQARMDHLTGFYNRRAFSELSERVFERARISDSTVALLALDLDHFKSVNDTFGHLAGDEALRAFARSVFNVTRPQDLVARLGGEEFVVLIPEAGESIAADVAERIRSATENLVIPGPEERTVIRITVSIGVALWGPEENYDFRSFYQRADQALYEAKSLGRNRVQLARSLKSVGEGNIVPVLQA